MNKTLSTWETSQTRKKRGCLGKAHWIKGQRGSGILAWRTGLRAVQDKSSLNSQESELLLVPRTICQAATSTQCQQWQGLAFYQFTASPVLERDSALNPD